ncbi:dehydrogenase [Solibacillus isronensis]|uniref:dehydrogenase n=1 Tax=Solibacillus isronensis TaxID=412383 RepID=UPI00203A4755|nr:dehydrogenase [Solibacillus isronensis]MCM3720955.1 dehydrogenase [Solibacillus isronensis]
MKLDDRLKQLNELPQNEALKKSIYQNIYKKPVRKRNTLKTFREIGVMATICFIGLFLLFTSDNLKNQAASGEIAKITSYENNGEKGFRGRTSTLFIGVENVTTAEMVTLFENISELPAVMAPPKSDVHYDIIVLYKNGEQRKFELAWNYLYDVKNDAYYPGYEQYPSAILSDLENSHDRLQFPPIFIGLGILVMIMLTSSYYSRRQIEQPKKIRGLGIVITIYMIVVASIGSYYFMIGPLYKPLLLLLLFGYGFSIWWLIKKEVTNLNILKVEKYKILFIVLWFLIWIVMA